MCGIAAILDPSGAEHDPAAILAALRHRGPDGEDSVRIGPALIAHTRLAIIDVPGGMQPLWSEDRACAVVVNGEIYNHAALRAELTSRGHRFATRSDSEVIVHGYEEWGSEVVRRLNGMFAFALWDDRRGRLLSARDPYGVKPLYWWSDGARVAVASEIGALLATGLVRPDVDRIALDHFLAWRFVPAPRTLFAGVNKLAAATTLVAEPYGAPRLASYRESPDPPLDRAGEQELERELADQLAAAVKRQMMSDVPYGAFLSGGVDSAAVVAAMAAAHDGAPQTFTIGFPGHGRAIDERAAARETAQRVGTVHRDTAMDEVSFPGVLAACVRRMEEPCGIPSAPALLQLGRFTAEHVKVALSGQGADEPLGGYQRHQAAAALALLGRVPSGVARPVRAALDLLPRNERIKRAARVLESSPGSDRLLGLFEITDARLRLELGSPLGVEAAAERAELAAGVLAHVADADVLGQALWLDTHLFLPDGLLTYGDKMTMAWGLEQRVPFLDVELMRFVQRIPARLRVRRARRKHLYRRAMRGVVPEGVLERRKVPFATPYDRWLREGLGAEIERRYGAGDGAGALVDRAAVQRLVAEHRAGRADRKRILYCLLELSEWHAAFMA